jgi:RNA polymerase sigma-70 factor (ECF subfamily)
MPSTRDSAGADDEFIAGAEAFRRELLTRCYRMTGSVDDAEDLVQETYLRAWKSYGGFEGRASLRTWLYRIATNACLTALQHRERRVLPSGLGVPSDDPYAPPVLGDPGTRWIRPVPDALFAAAPDGPEATVISRDSIRLALIASLQYLPPKQRAVLILRDVLAWPAAEVAKSLDTTTAAVKSLLQRAAAASRRSRRAWTGASPPGGARPTAFGVGMMTPTGTGIARIIVFSDPATVHRLGGLDFARRTAEALPGESTQ